MRDASSTHTRLTTRPSGPVWWVTRGLPNRPAAKAAASSAVWTTLTPPALPLPPACIWAFTTHGKPTSRAAARASSAVAAVRPSGVGTPNRASHCFAWYSWTFMESGFRGAGGKRQGSYAWASTLSMAPTSSCTRDRERSNAPFSSGVRSISMTCSTPPAPISTGTQK